jgi:hypothetical protein
VVVRVGAPTKNLFKDLNKEEIAKIWAEAKYYYETGEKLVLDAEMEVLAKEVQTEHIEFDDRVGLIREYLKKPITEDWKDLDVFQRRSYLNGEDDLVAVGKVQRTRVCVAEIWQEVFGGSIKDMTRYNVNEIHNIMQNMKDWVRHEGKIKFGVYGVQRGYLLKGSADEKAVAVMGKKA